MNGQTPIQRVEIFRETLDKLTLNMRTVLNKLSPLLKQIIVIIGVIFLIKTFVDLLPAGGIFTLYQKDKGTISEKELENRFIGGYVTWGFFWIIAIILSSYIIAQSNQKYKEIEPDLEILSKEIRQLNKVTLELGKDFSKGVYVAAQIMSQPAFQNYVNQPSSSNPPLIPIKYKTSNSSYKNMPKVIEEVD